MNERKQKIIKRMFTVSLCIFGGYLLITLAICLMPGMFLTLLMAGYPPAEEPVFNAWSFGGQILTGVLFVTVWCVSRNKVRVRSEHPVLCGVFNAVVAFLVCQTIPFIIDRQINVSIPRILAAEEAASETVIAYQLVPMLVSAFDFLLFASVVLFLCAYVVYWCDVCCARADGQASQE